MKKLSLVGIVVLGLFLVTGSVFAVSSPVTLTVNATVSATAKLAFDQTTISFPNKDPDTDTSIPSSPASVIITAKAKTGKTSTADLTCLATGDLTATGDNIAISNVTWTGSGTGFNATGTMNKTTAQPVAHWTGSGNRSGTNSYSLANSWDYSTGDYTQSVVYTLVAP